MEVPGAQGIINNKYAYVLRHKTDGIHTLKILPHNNNISSRREVGDNRLK